MSDIDRDERRYGEGAFDPVMIDDPDTYDATGEDDDAGPARGWIMLLVVLAVIAGLAAVIYLAYQQGREEGIRTAPPILRAEGGPEKVAPSDPGGMEIPHQDKKIFERITGDGAAEETASGVERLLPPPEEPLADLAQAPATPSAPESAPAAGETAPSAGNVERLRPAAPAPAATPRPAPAAPARSTSADAPAPAAQGGWVVQVGAFRDAAQANAQWAALVRRHGDILQTAAPDIKQVDLGAKGVWYRLRAAGYAGKDEAEAACARLKAAGTDCLVRRR